MTVVYRTSDVRLAERRRYWCDALSRTFVPLEVQKSAESGFFGELSSERLGAALISELWSRPQACVRSTDTINRRGGNNLLQVGLLLAGNAEVSQDGRTAPLHPGSLVIYETSRSFCWSFPATDWKLMILTLPRAGFTVPAAGLREVTARDLSGSTVTGAILAACLRQLHDRMPTSDGAVAARLGDTAADLVATTMLECLPSAHTAGPPQPALCRKVLRYIEDNLEDPDLSPARIAEAHYISRRYLYKIFTTSQGRPVLEWIHARRLDRCRHDLLDPALGGAPVGRIAARWGITNAALFSRTFKCAYGLSPSEYRHRFGPFEGCSVTPPQPRRAIGDPPPPMPATTSTYL